MARFRERLRESGKDDPDQEATRLEQEAQKLSYKEGISLTQALAKVEEGIICARVPDANAKMQSASLRFICDAGLGGLARWLRAAGYEADWKSHISDEELISAARQSWATVLTTNSILIERKLFRDRILPYLWVAPAFGVLKQLAAVVREFHLEIREPRCMSCGGESRRQSKETLKDRIPPKTLVWLDEYFVCSRCDKLFWKGTHWERIGERLNAVFTLQTEIRMKNDETGNKDEIRK